LPQGGEGGYGFIDVCGKKYGQEPKQKKEEKLRKIGERRMGTGTRGEII